MDSNKSAYYYLSKYRSELMGLAILWVVWFHSGLDLGNIRPVLVGKGLRFLKDIGYGGVDIFLLLSGMGIYSSLEKHDISIYVKNRLSRLLPTWWAWLLILFAISLAGFYPRMTAKQFLGFLTFTGYWLNMEYQGSWYVYAIVLFYLVSPILMSLIDKSKKRKAICYSLIMLALVISTAFFGHGWLMIASRVPVYILGMMIAADKRECLLSRARIIIGVISFILGVGMLCCFLKYLDSYLWQYGLWWYPFFLIAPPLAIAIAMFLEYCGKYLRVMRFVLKNLGAASLEILLVSDYFFNYFSKRDLSSFLPVIRPFLLAFIGIILGWLFHMFLQWARKIII